MKGGISKIGKSHTNVESDSDIDPMPQSEHKDQSTESDNARAEKIYKLTNMVI